MFIAIMVLSLVGALFSVWAYVVEQRTLAQPTYKAACDISDTVSCSKPITTGYNKLLGISNALLGIFFYIVLFVCAFLGLAQLVSIALAIALVGTVIFAYILCFKVKALCLLCAATYAINVIMCIVWFLF